MTSPGSNEEIKTLVCKRCGKEFPVYKGHEKRLFCSRKCCQAAHRRDYVKKKLPCKFQEGVACTAQKCEKCGWNPQVQERRKKEMTERSF